MKKVLFSLLVLSSLSSVVYAGESNCAYVKNSSNHLSIFVDKTTQYSYVETTCGWKFVSKVSDMSKVPLMYTIPLEERSKITYAPLNPNDDDELISSL